MSTVSGNLPWRQLEAIVGILELVLGPDLVGTWLHGSAVLGGLRPRSDIDVLAISRRPTVPRERSAP
jgi:streptomycin 3"-adenylyltransferase